MNLKFELREQHTGEYKTNYYKRFIARQEIKEMKLNIRSVIFRCVLRYELLDLETVKQYVLKYYADGVTPIDGRGKEKGNKGGKNSMRTIPYETNSAGICITECPFKEKIGPSIINVNSLACTEVCKHYYGQGTNNSIICEHPEE